MAVAVTLVALFHLGVRALPGGYVGVDVFFPISGFLITGPLLRERAASGSIDITRFWMRRARRLLPALALVLVVCGAAASVVGGDVLVGLRRQMLGAVTFGYNWLAIADGSRYLDATTPELLRNLWSLAVEEQFYLVWPALLLMLWTTPSRRARLGAVLAIAVASAVAMAAGGGAGATTRVYYGADTHSFGLALGAALAIVWLDWPGLGAPATNRGRRTAALFGAFAIVGLVAKAMVMPAAGPAMYEGDLALVALLAIVAIACATHPGSALGRALDVPPLRWVGLVALAVTVIASDLSYRFLETPVPRVRVPCSSRRPAPRNRHPCRRRPPNAHSPSAGHRGPAHPHRARRRAGAARLDARRQLHHHRLRRPPPKRRAVALARRHPAPARRARGRS
ncbi:MAG: oatA 3, partial [Microbacteriaceae bacterium]|nr:oatA 3 [Microbacteriaceae bacterium]